MTKPELINRIAEKASLSKKDAAAAVAALIATITETLQAGEKIAFPNLGSFEVRERAARTGRNPRTGETINIPETNVPAFKAAKLLKDTVE